MTGKTTLTVPELLRAARNVLRQKKWIKNHFAIDGFGKSVLPSQNPCAVCALGALQVAFYNKTGKTPADCKCDAHEDDPLIVVYRQAEDQCDFAAGRKIGKEHCSIVNYNDSIAKSKSDVLRVFELAEWAAE